MIAIAVVANSSILFKKLTYTLKNGFIKSSISSQLLSVDRLGLIASSLRLSLLVFESLRQELKFQLEVRSSPSLF